MFLVKCGHSLLVATIRKNESMIEKTKSLVEDLSIFMCKFRGGEQSRISFIRGGCRCSDQSSSPHRMHVANDEK